MTTEMKEEKKGTKKRKLVAWGITGCGDRLGEVVEVMTEVKRQYEEDVDLRPYVSKAGNEVLTYYRLVDTLKENFGRIRVEVNSNSPFLAGALQLGRFEFLMIAPSTSNTVAKISLGIGDSLLSNAAIMALKAFVPVYIMPSDYREGGLVLTKLPGGQHLKLRTRKEDVEHVKNLAAMEDVFVLETPEDIHQVFEKHFGRG